jgi:transposase InsO family protein
LTKDDVLFGYRQQLFAEAARTSVSEACRRFGVHRSTYYAWKRQVDRHGLEVLRPRERRRPQMPNQLPKMVEERIVSFALAHPGLGPRRVASELRRAKWGGIVVSPNGVWKVLCRHGLNTRAKRLGLIAGYAAPYEPPRDPGPEQHIDVDRPGELVGIDCFYVGRLRGTEGAIWQLTAIDVASSFAWVELVICKQGNPTAEQTSRLARRVARDLKAAGWRLERVLTDNGNEFRGLPFVVAIERLKARHSRIHAGRPQTNGNVEALHKTILDECWRPAFARYLYPRFTGLRRELHTYLRFYNSTASTTAASPAARSPQTSSTVPARWRPDEPHLSAHLGGRPP